MRTAVAPTPTAEATRLIDRYRTSPAANRPRTEVSSGGAPAKRPPTRITSGSRGEVALAAPEQGDTPWPPLVARWIAGGRGPGTDKQALLPRPGQFPRLITRRNHRGAPEALPLPGHRPAPRHTSWRYFSSWGPGRMGTELRGRPWTCPRGGAQVRTEQGRAQPSTTEQPRAKCAPICAPTS